MAGFSDESGRARVNLASEGISESPENAPRCALMGENRVREEMGAFTGKGLETKKRAFHRVYERVLRTVEAGKYRKENSYRQHYPHSEGNYIQ